MCWRVESVLEAGECLKDVKGTKVEEGGLEGRGKGKGDEGGRRSPRGKEKGETWRWKTWPLFAWAETWPLLHASAAMIQNSSSVMSTSFACLHHSLPPTFPPTPGSHSSYCFLNRFPGSGSEEASEPVG